MEIGRVAQIARYPVKSMMGEQLETALMTEHGIEGDRIYALVQKDPPNERFPWMTARERILGRVGKRHREAIY